MDLRPKQQLKKVDDTAERSESFLTPQMTIWRFSLYGGAVFSGDPDAPEECHSAAGAVTGTKLVIAKFAALAQGHSAPAA